MNAAKPDRLLRVLLGWTAVTMIFVWLPLIRGLLDGASYQWGASYWGYRIRGAGTGGDYWLVAIQGLLGMSVLALGWRGARAPFHALLLAWHGVLGSNAIYAAVTSPESYRFRGDTMGIDVSLAWVGPLFFGGFLLLALWWVIRDCRSDGVRRAPAWGWANFAWLAILVLLLPVQFVLLRFGEPHGLTDKIGVVITIAQCLLLGRIFRPGRSGAQAGFLAEPALAA